VSALPPYAAPDLVGNRLRDIFPEGTPHRGYCVRLLAARTVFAALYMGAVEGSGRYFGPVHVYRMTEEQAAITNETDRLAYAGKVQKNQVLGKRWYADNSRESIRDETLREGLIAVGAVVQREDLATTSGSPRYALNTDFAALFDPVLTSSAFDAKVSEFQERYLSKGALAKIAIIRAGAAGSAEGVLVTFPNRETRRLEPGPSSAISQAVVEVFASRFLKEPAVLWLSESGNKVVLRDDRIASLIGLKIEPDKNLPDMILADLGHRETFLVFVEVVATDGAVTSRRQDAVFALTDAAGFKRSQVAFLTAYQSRESAGFRKTVSQVAWGSFVWFSSEPENLVVFRAGQSSPQPLYELIVS
jgi:BsuBI/PstI restriction endonuclease domain/BsuBI/PstI restriction endonuclease HTH domain